MAAFHRPTLAVLLVVPVLVAVPLAAADTIESPMKFFEGRTDSSGTLKVMLSGTRRSTSIGHGRIHADGSLSLVQQVDEVGRPRRERRWTIRQVGPGRYSGTMSEATGPVSIEEVGGRYRLRLRMAGGLNVEQWLTPMSGGRAARSDIVVRKMGVTVARGEGVIRKVP
jgi:hypothetical protein